MDGYQIEAQIRTQPRGRSLQLQDKLLDVVYILARKASLRCINQLPTAEFAILK